GASGPTGPTGPTGATGSGYTATSTTSLTIGTGSKSFTTQAGLAYTSGARIRASSAANSANYMEGVVSSYSGTTLAVTVDRTGDRSEARRGGKERAGDGGATGANGTTRAGGTGATGAPGATGPSGPNAPHAP